MKDTFLEDQQFWQALTVLTNLSSARPQQQVIQESGLSAEMIAQSTHFLQLLNIDISIVEIEGELWLKPPEQWPKVRFEFGVLEWMAFQAHFPFLENLKNTPFFEILSGILGQTEKKQQGLDLFTALERMSARPSQSHLTLVGEKNEGVLMKELEKALLWHLPVQLSFHSKVASQFSKQEGQLFYPLRLCYLEGQMHVIGESKREHCLHCIGLEHLADAVLVEEAPHHGPFGHLEIDQFLAGLRSMGGPEVRLVLKIRPGPNHQLTPPYHYLGAPYRVTNSEGEIIWAATVEPCSALYLWVASLGDQVEVLDPSSFREELKNYQRQKKLGQF